MYINHINPVVLKVAVTVGMVDNVTLPARDEGTLNLINQALSMSPSRSPQSSHFLTGIPRKELSLVSDSDKPATPKNRLAAAAKLDTTKEGELTASVTTAKTTLGHSAVVEARNAAYRVS